MLSVTLTQYNHGNQTPLFTYAVTETLVTTSLLGCFHNNGLAAGEAAGKHDNNFATLKADRKKYFRD